MKNLTMTPNKTYNSTISEAKERNNSSHRKIYRRKVQNNLFLMMMKLRRSNCRSINKKLMLLNLLKQKSL